jgi:hypothetical protein
MDMNPDEFWNMLPREFFLKQHGFNDQVERNERNQWEMIRWQTAYLLQPHMKKGKKMKPTDLIKFPWEEKKSKSRAEILKNRKEMEYYAKLYGSKVKTSNGEK